MIFSSAPNDYLMHYGIKGQKWGIRRYQNPDGTLTAEGKARYGFGDQTNDKIDHYHLRRFTKGKTVNEIANNIRNTKGYKNLISDYVKESNDTLRKANNIVNKDINKKDLINFISKKSINDKIDEALSNGSSKHEVAKSLANYYLKERTKDNFNSGKMLDLAKKSVEIKENYDNVINELVEESLGKFSNQPTYDYRLAPNALSIWGLGPRTVSIKHPTLTNAVNRAIMNADEQKRVESQFETKSLTNPQDKVDEFTNYVEEYISKK